MDINVSHETWLKGVASQHLLRQKPRKSVVNDCACAPAHRDMTFVLLAALTVNMLLVLCCALNVEVKSTTNNSTTYTDINLLPIHCAFPNAPVWLRAGPNYALCAPTHGGIELSGIEGSVGAYNDWGDYAALILARSDPFVQHIVTPTLDRWMDYVALILAPSDPFVQLIEVPKGQESPEDILHPG